MRELTIEETQQVGGGLTGTEAAGLILAVMCISLTPVTLGVGLGAAAGLVIAETLAKSSI